MGLNWNVWIVVLTPAYEPIITNGMVKLGLEVTALAGDGKVNFNAESKNMGTTLAYRVCDPKGFMVQDLLTKIENILAKNKVYYYSLIISESTHHCSWFSSNISLEDKKPARKLSILN